VCHNKCQFANNQKLSTKYGKFIKKTKTAYQQQNRAEDLDNDDTATATANKRAKADGNKSN